jgi:uncharacterized protein YndB with AHSA1/START domain
MSDDNQSVDAVVIQRTFDAPKEVLWRLWTDPDQFAAWYGPDGATIPVAKMDVRVGGSRLVCMEVNRPGELARMWFAGQYVEVVDNERLVYTEAVSDENGNPLSPSDIGMPGDHPRVTQVRVEFHDAEGGTNIVLTHSGVPSDSPGAAGWTMALEKLASRAASA